MLTNILFLSILSVLFILLFIYLQKRKTVCPNCKSGNIVKTGNTKYKEDPVAILGSPDSYHQIEYRCEKCGNIFWEKHKAFIFN